MFGYWKLRFGVLLDVGICDLEFFMRSSLQKVFKKVEKDKTKYAGISKETGEFLFDFCVKNKVKNILEIGSGIGYSTLWLAAAAEKNKGKVISFEYNSCNATKAEENLKAAGLADFAEIKIKDAVKYILDLFDNHFDFIFIDGSNRKYYQFIDLCYQKLKNKKYIVCDNVSDLAVAEKTFYQALQMQKLFEKIKKDDRFEIEMLNVGTGLLILQKIK